MIIDEGHGWYPRVQRIDYLPSTPIHIPRLTNVVTSEVYSKVPPQLVVTLINHYCWRI